MTMQEMPGREEARREGRGTRGRSRGGREEGRGIRAVAGEGAGRPRGRSFLHGAGGRSCLPCLEPGASQDPPLDSLARVRGLCFDLFLSPPPTSPSFPATRELPAFLLLRRLLPSVPFGRMCEALRLYTFAISDLV